MSETLKEGRRITLIALSIATLWLLTGGSVQSDLEIRQIVSVSTWASVNKTVQTAFSQDIEDTFVDVPVGTKISSYSDGLVPLQSGTEQPNSKPLRFRAWDTEKETAFELTKISGPGELSIFEISSLETSTILERFVVVDFGSRGIRLIERLETGSSEREYLNAAFRDGKDRPEISSAAINYLRSHGWTGTDPSEILASDPVIAEALADIRARNYSLSGFSISVVLYPAAVGVVLGLAAFGLVGPISKMRRQHLDLSNEVWVMAIPSDGRWGRIILSAQVSMVLLAVALLLWASKDLWTIRGLIDSDNRLIHGVGVIGSFSASIAVACFGLELIKANHFRKGVVRRKATRAVRLQTQRSKSIQRRLRRSRYRRD